VKKNEIPMTLLKKITGKFPFIMLLLIYSCVDKDFTNIVDNSYYTPSFSLPLGNHTFTMGNIEARYSNSFIEVPDSLNSNDSLFIINYDSTSYNTPQQFDFPMENVFNFNMFTQNVDNITLLMFRLNCINKIPGKVYLQVYFLDVLENPIDSLYQSGRIELKAATVNNDGSLKQAYAPGPIDTYLDSTMISKLRNVNYIEILAQLVVEDYSISSIKYLPEQEFWSQFAFRVEFDIPVNEL
jgi:hypothetical protein